jgi:predicted RNase H-like HicB family nuclease
MNIKAIIHPAEEGGYWAEVPALPGCITEGDSMEEVVANLKDAILLLERLRQRRLARCWH